MCTCLEEVDAQAQEQGIEIVVDQHDRPVIRTRPVEGKQASWLVLVARHCPFCGERYAPSEVRDG